MWDTATSNRESADHYHTIIEKTETHRVILCREGLQWIIQFRSGKTVAGPRWRSISYCTTREALTRLWPQVTGQALLTDIPERIGGGHG